MQILCTPTEDANGEANEGDGWLAGFYQGQVYFPALGRIYRGAWCWRRRCCRAGTWRGWVLPCIVDTVASSAGEPQSPRRPERYAFDLCEELDVESLGCTMYTRVNDLVSINSYGLEVFEQVHVWFIGRGK